MENIKKSTKNVRLGKDYKLRFGDNILTLAMGSMTLGSRLPSLTNLVTPELERIEIPAGVRKTILTVPSLDTPVCESQIKMLSESLAEEDTGNYYVISIDTPFAQARFIRENNISPKIKFISDYADRRFMVESGLRIIELNIFARSIIECDEKNIVTAVIIPEDITQVP